MRDRPVNVITTGAEVELQTTSPVAYAVVSDGLVKFADELVVFSPCGTGVWSEATVTGSEAEDAFCPTSDAAPSDS